jgi:hypothetical protein
VGRLRINNIMGTSTLLFYSLQAMGTDDSRPRTQLALVLSSILFAVVLNLGYGRDPSEIAPENVDRMLLFVSVSSSLLILANLWSKTSFGITLLRLPLGRVRVRLVCALIAAGTVVIGASACLVWIQCLVADPPWSPYVGVKCLAPDILIRYSVFVGYFSALIDLSFVVLPWKMLWSLQMKKAEKVGVTLTMGMGTLAGVAAIAKTTVFPRVYDADHIAPLLVSGWGAVETAVSICAASIPILRALVRQGRDGGAPVGYQTGQTAQVHSDVRSVFFQRTWLAPSRTGSGVGREPVVEEVLVGEAMPGKDDGMKTSMEMDSYGAEVRPRDFTV